MLKIKDDKWQEFCEKYIEYGFEKNQRFIDANNEYIKGFINGDLYIFENNKIIDDYSEYNGSVNLDNIYDLIQSGFVEKVEEQ